MKAVEFMNSAAFFVFVNGFRRVEYKRGLLFEEKSFIKGRKDKSQPS